MGKSYSGGFRKNFFSFLKVIALIVMCVGISILIVWPLWKFSTALPKAFTLIVIIAVIDLLLFLIIKKIIKTPVINTVQFFSNMILICGGLFFTVRFLLFQNRLFALLTLAAAAVLIVIANIIFSRMKNRDR